MRHRHVLRLVWCVWSYPAFEWSRAYRKAPFEWSPHVLRPLSFGAFHVSEVVARFLTNPIVAMTEGMQMQEKHAQRAPNVSADAALSPDAFAISLALNAIPKTDWATLRCGQALASDIARASSFDFAQVLDALTLVPQEMLCLLQSPQGWSELAQCVATDLGVESINYHPQIH